ncbi:THAP domain-containing protein 5-like isoform X1 [Chiloscyllium plagiosum]|uniref:THAP domain-containing protein 5-like isoform X1 n=1 Tax=Chiloscyllium plagiosum TaxID=36176 RepID=UPI001CB854A3|nr:THAP domain-containing protein 5-like isoform X1 [Chiloscyllium plagiosum]
MPKNCTVTNCWRHAGQLAADKRRISFYKFPLNDKERLAKWLSNMKKEKWLPSQYQYVCSEHFTPDNFEWKWGTRYLKADAVPTMFSFPEQPTKRKALARSIGNKWKKKRLEGQNNEDEMMLQMQTVPVQSHKMSEPDALALLVMTTEPTLSTSSNSINEADKVPVTSGSACIDSTSESITPAVQPLLNMTVNPFELLQIDKGRSPPSVLMEPSLLPFENVAAVETVPLTPTLTSVETGTTATTLPTVETSQLVSTQMCEESEPGPIEMVLPAAQDIEMLTSFQLKPPPSVPSTPAMSNFEDVETASAAVSTDQTLSLTNLSSPTSTILMAAATETLTKLSGFETLLTVPSAVLVPIMSTSPIVQNHAVMPTGAVIAAVETVVPALPDLSEVQGEHSYYKSDLPIDQLERIIANLQKKVKVIQQRERRNSVRLKAMESLVDQLKSKNIISKEKLKIMEMTCSQTNAQVIHPSSSDTVVCEDNDNIIYAHQQSPNDNGHML